MCICICICICICTCICICVFEDYFTILQLQLQCMAKYLVAKRPHVGQLGNKKLGTAAPVQAHLAVQISLSYYLESQYLSAHISLPYHLDSKYLCAQISLSCHLGSKCSFAQISPSQFRPTLLLKYISPFIWTANILWPKYLSLLSFGQQIFFHCPNSYLSVFRPPFCPNIYLQLTIFVTSGSQIL